MPDSQKRCYDQAIKQGVSVDEALPMVVDGLVEATVMDEGGALPTA